MKNVIASLSVIILGVLTLNAQWVKQRVNTNAAFRGLSVVNEKVVWASGTGGTVIRTTDGGKTWRAMTVPGAEKLDFRDIEAFDAKTAYILSIGNGETSRIYKTKDGGDTWELKFKNADEKAFFDAIGCWDKDHCIAMSDPVNGVFLLMASTDGGETWTKVAGDNFLMAKDGEAAFAASGTCLITSGKSDVFLVSGGNTARVFHSANRGWSWTVNETPIVKGSSGSGIFSIAIWDETHGVIVGGNYENPNDAKDSLAFTSDGGKTWVAGSGLGGYRSGVAYVNEKTIIAVGTNGSDISRDRGKTWASLDKENYNSVAAQGNKAVWAVGPAGHVARLEGK